MLQIRTSQHVAGMMLGLMLAVGALNGAARAGTVQGPTAYGWSSTGGRSTDRWLHTATPLVSGEVLVAGGGGDQGYLASAELYDPVTGAWRVSGGLGVARQSHTATLLPNGKVLVAGGQGMSGYLNSAELYDPATGAWAPTGGMRTPRSHHQAILLPDGKVLVAGGYGNTGFLDAAELYDPSTESWSVAASLNTARGEHSISRLQNGQVLVVGGFGTAGMLKSAELYTPSAGTWGATGGLNVARYYFMATTLQNGQVLVAGGGDLTGCFNVVEAYDPQTGAWRVISAMNTARLLQTATLLESGELLVAGGYGAGGVAIDGAELYDPRTETWTPARSMQTARTYQTATLLGSGAVLVTGGFDQADNFTRSSELFGAQKAGQTITFAALAQRTFGDPEFTVSATASSGLAVTFTASGQCTVSGSTVQITGAGSCTVTASQAGDPNFNAALDVARPFGIAKAAQTISFGPPADKTFGDAAFPPSATASSGLDVSFSAAGQCAVTGTTVHITGAGSCSVTASQGGDTNYSAAPGVSRTFQVAKAQTTTALSSSPNPSGPGQPVSFTATVTSDAGAPTGTVQFKVGGANLGPPVALGAGGATFTTSGLADGAHAVTADYVGDSNFSASTGTLVSGQVVAGAVEFSQALYAVSEREGSITINVSRTGDASGALSIDYATDDGGDSSAPAPCSAVTGDALERCDYTRAAGTLNFAAGETQKTFTVLVGDDAYAEGAETLRLRLSKPTGGAVVLGPQSAATLRITDDATESPGNPSDDDGAFVIQHYHDFLGREPDAAGLRFWTEGIKACGTDRQCREVRRVHTSAAFFLSIEFQQTGFYAFRLHQAAFGGLPGAPAPVRLDAFLLDTRELGQGVVVGQGDWQARLDQNKEAFALAFVRRPEFAARYPASTSAPDFIDLLDANAGFVLAPDEKGALVAELSANPADAALRAGVLRRVAGDPELARREFNRAFVLMQYFGYLRRDPDAAPDKDSSGFDFWLSKLGLFGGNFDEAEMVKAFISSTEYRQRFGQ